MSSQGATANSNGKNFETLIIQMLEQWGFKKERHVYRDQINKTFTTDFPYETVYTQYGGAAKSEIAFFHPHTGLCRIECKWQQRGGSVDEKFVFCMETAKIENEDTVIFIMDGDGYRPCAIDWLKSEAEASNKPIMVMSMAEFLKFGNDVLRG